MSFRSARRGPSPAASRRVDGAPTDLPPAAKAIAQQYLLRILRAKVYSVAIETPLIAADSLSKRLGHAILLKREDAQTVNSFKVRGAFNCMAQMGPAALARGVICASAGNHAQGVALSARRLRARAVIVMPVTTPQVKIDAVHALGGDIVLYGDSYTDAYEHAVRLQTQQGLSFVHPFDDPDVIAGQGTVGLEILRQHPAHIDAVFVPVGGGGLIAGVAAYIKAVRPEIKVIGVQTTDSNGMALSVRNGAPTRLAEVGLFSDGTAVKLVGTETFRLSQALVDDFITVNTDPICAAVKDVFQETRRILEPAGALSVAGLKKYVESGCRQGQTLIAITSGANINFDRLRFVADRAELGERREALFAVMMPKQRDAFLRLCELVSDTADRARKITEFNYRSANTPTAPLFIGLSITRPDEAGAVLHHLESHGFSNLDLTDDDLAKDHLRHMIGGRAKASANERLFRFEFPDRPGALLHLLSALKPDWELTLFHYRHQGADVANVLVGIVANGSPHSLTDILGRLDYPFVEETGNPSYCMFLR